MPLITTSLHYTYQPKLDALWGLREIVSNAIDGEERHRHLGIGAMTIRYKKRTQTVVVRSANIGVSSTSLLMGTSDSREDQKCIGQFGEGLPMGLLCMERDPLLSVVIFNGAEKWEPAIERVAAYDNEPVLVVKTRKLKKDRDGFEVHVKGVSHEQFKELQGRFLRLDGNFAPAETICRTGDSGSYSGERVLLQPEYNGKIYNKGVFIMEREDLMFGYDLQGELTRDRHMMDEYTLKNALGSLLNDALEHNEERFAAVLANTFFSDQGVLELDDEYSDLAYNCALRDRVAEIFVEKYGENAIAVDNDDDIEAAKTLGLRGVRCSNLLGKMLRRRLGYLSQIQEDRKKAIQVLWADEDLPEAEKANFDTIKLLVQSAMPEAKDMTFEVVTFGSNEVKFLHNNETQTIQLAFGHLLDFESTLVSAVKAATILRGDWDGAVLVLSCLIAQLTQGKGTAALALNLIAQEG